MVNEALCDDRRHHLGRVVLPLPAVEAQRERQGVGKVIGRGGREGGGQVDHAGDRSLNVRTRQEHQGRISG